MFLRSLWAYARDDFLSGPRTLMTRPYIWLRLGFKIIKGGPSDAGCVVFQVVCGFLGLSVLLYSIWDHDGWSIEGDVHFVWRNPTIARHPLEEVCWRRPSRYWALRRVSHCRSCYIFLYIYIFSFLWLGKMATSTTCDFLSLCPCTFRPLTPMSNVGPRTHDLVEPWSFRGRFQPNQIRTVWRKACGVRYCAAVSEL